jgi:hypothetical protein
VVATNGVAATIPNDIGKEYNSHLPKLAVHFQIFQIDFLVFHQNTFRLSMNFALAGKESKESSLYARFHTLATHSLAAFTYLPKAFTQLFHDSTTLPTAFQAAPAIYAGANTTSHPQFNTFFKVITLDVADIKLIYYTYFTVFCQFYLILI